MLEDLTGYELSKDWFDWCFENPELISGNHTAMYFFIIEHWNRMGHPPKFALPMEMTKSAVGIKNYKTFSKVFEDINNWGFIKVIQRSKNQYSSNIVALVKNTKATTKALTKASLKHLPKQVHGTVGIVEDSKLLNIETINNSWRDDFEVYKNQVYLEFEKLKLDEKFISEQERFNPNVDIILSIEKSIVNFWATQKGWKNKKKSKSEDPDWKSTFKNTISINKVFKQYGTKENFRTDSKKYSIAGTVESINASTYEQPYDPRFDFGPIEEISGSPGIQ